LRNVGGDWSFRNVGGSWSLGDYMRSGGGDWTILGSSVDCWGNSSDGLGWSAGVVDLFIGGGSDDSWISLNIVVVRSGGVSWVSLSVVGDYSGGDCGFNSVLVDCADSVDVVVFLRTGRHLGL
jgi:hypothetical protein